MSRIFNTKNIRILLLMLVDAIIMYVSALIALLITCDLSFDILLNSGYMEELNSYVPILIICGIAALMIFHLYESVWVFAGSYELPLIIAASVLSVAAFQVIVLLAGEFPFSKSFFIVYLMLIAIFITGNRFSYRLARKTKRAYKNKKGKRTMIIGGGRAGAMMIDEFNSNSHSQNYPVAVIDDDPSKVGKRIKGVRIVGDSSTIEYNVRKYNIEELLIAVPSMKRIDRIRIYDRCKDLGISVKTLPTIAQLANGDVNISLIRDINIEDLLGRDEIVVEPEEIGSLIRDKVILVTGGGGSIGSELCRQIASNNPAKLIIFDIYENGAYAIQQEIKNDYPDVNITVLIGSVRDMVRMESVIDTLRPDIVYHAAAHKHVPLMEDSPVEAVKNNILGTWNVAECCDKYNIRKMVLVSTDKAVRPTNVMGASKRICEMIIQMYDRKSDTKYTAVRFGNVMGSNGSVIPLFMKQIEKGGPVTVTHKDIIRYFMTIPEAVSLILQSGVNAAGGEIFVLDMGEPVKIDTLARNMIKMAGFVPDVDIPIVYTGLRPGEKLFEEMLLDEEGLTQTDNSMIFVGKPIEMDDEKLCDWIRKISEFVIDDANDCVVSDMVKVGDKYVNVYSDENANIIKEKIHELVPEYDSKKYSG